MTQIPSELIRKLGKFINTHERASMMGMPCPICRNYYFNILLLDKSIVERKFLENLCKTDNDICSFTTNSEISLARSVILVIGNHWSILDKFKYKKIKYIAAGKKLDYEINHELMQIPLSYCICVTDCKKFDKTWLKNLTHDLIFIQISKTDFDYICKTDFYYICNTDFDYIIYNGIKDLPMMTLFDVKTNKYFQ